jgi:hypothetical protein
MEELLSKMMVRMAYPLLLVSLWKEAKVWTMGI